MTNIVGGQSTLGMNHNDLIQAMQDGKVLDYRFGYVRFFIKDGILYVARYREGEPDKYEFDGFKKNLDDVNVFEILPKGSSTKPNFPPYVQGVSVWNDSGEV